MLLEGADKAIRRMVKSALHLPIQMSNAPLYDKRIPDIIIGRLHRLSILDDLPIGVVLESQPIFLDPFTYGEAPATL